LKRRALGAAAPKGASQARGQCVGSAWGPSFAAGPGLRLNEHLEHEDGEMVFRHACKLGLEGIVSKRKGSPYRSGRSPERAE